MATLKADRDIKQYRLDYQMNTTGNKGGLVSASSVSSGVGFDGNNVCAYAANPSGAQVLGVLLDNVENYGAKTPRNHYGENVNISGQVGIASEGWVVTDWVYPGVTPTAGQAAYLGHSGYFTNVQTPAQAPKVGRFETSKDEGGFVKVSVNIPL